MPDWVRNVKRAMVDEYRQQLKTQKELERHARRNAEILTRDILDLRRELGE